MAKKENDSWGNAEEVQSAWVKFNVPQEDKVKAVFLQKRTMKSTIPGKEGDKVNVYELKGIEGSYHVLDDKKKLVEQPVMVEEGAFYSVGGTAVIDRQMQNIKVGQVIGFKFIEEKPSKTKGFAPAKIVKVYQFKNEDGSLEMDEAVLNEARLDDFDAE